jgi:RNA polymerase sigma factor for flagellar operon FliA
MKKNQREELAREYLPLVEAVVSKEQRKLGLGQEYRDELRSSALEGLAFAVSRYDSNRDVSFQSYAQIRIRGAIYDGLDHQDWFPRRLRRRMAFYRKSEELLQTMAFSPPPADRVEAVHRMADSLKELATAYVSCYVAEGERDIASVGPDAECVLEHKHLKKLLHSCIDKLPEKQQDVVIGYFFKDRKLSEIAQRMGVSTSWVSRLLSVALRNLREHLGEPTSWDVGG